MKIKHNGTDAVLRELSCGSVFFYKDETFIVTDGSPVNLRTGQHQDVHRETRVVHKKDAYLLLEGCS